VKGILLAGGTGSRLAPLTRHISKQLLPVYDKPLIYYPLSTLMLAGIREICVISSPRDIEPTKMLLRESRAWGLSLTFAVQEEPRGIADAFRLASPHLGVSPVCLVLGDNILHGPRLGVSLQGFSNPSDAVIFASEVADPSAYGVVELDHTGRPISLVEKPRDPKSRLAVPGLYFYPSDVYEVAGALSPSSRGELEISDLNAAYLAQGRLKVVELPRGTAWLDCGTIDDLFEATTYIQVLTRRQGTRIGCPEEVAWRNEWISDDQLNALAEPLRASGYGEYLRSLLG
jgi:glucose-1-phosphate thymidylyltransferase